MSADKESRRDKVFKWVTFGIAVAGAGIAVASFVRTSAVDVSLTASESAFATRSFTVGLVNSSQRAVSITGGTVEFDGYRVGEAARLIPGTGAGEEAAASGLPFALAGGQAFSGKLEWTLPEAGYSPDLLKAFERYLGKSRRGSQKADGRLVLKLDHDPGGEVEAEVRLSVGGFDEPSSQKGHARGWNSALVLGGERQVRAIALYSQSRAPRIATFQLWGDEPEPISTATRPVIYGREGTRFSFPAGLRPGRYSFAVESGGATVAVGTVVTPCPGTVRVLGVGVPSDACDPDG